MLPEKKVFAVLLAAGSGTRMGQNKIELTFGGKTPLRLSYEAFQRSSHPPSKTVIVTSDAVRPQAEALAAEEENVFVVGGGETRGDSVFNALSFLVRSGETDGIAAIHDAARCLVPGAVIDAAVEGAALYGSGIAAIPVRDTVRDSDGNDLPRDRLRLMQTPQAFELRLIYDAYSAAKAQGITVTDDCALYRLQGHVPFFTEGSIMNQKLTYPEDIPFFRAALEKTVPAIGYGEDTHVLQEGRKLILGGVEIPYEKGLLGHSDADVLCHALTDAILGAAALGDIGRHFPDTDERYRGISSVLLLKEAWVLVKQKGFAFGNADITVVAQRPKLAPHIDAMRKIIAEALGVPLERVSIKATTSEKMNDEGAGKCITARAVTVLLR